MSLATPLRKFLALALLATPLFAADARAETAGAPLSTAAQAGEESRVADSVEVPTEFTDEHATWSRTFAAAGSYVAGGKAEKAETELYSELLADVVDQATELKAVAEAELETNNRLLKALGPAPNPEMNETEPADVAALRAGYLRAVGTAKSQIVAADVAMVRAEDLRVDIARLARDELASQLNKRTSRSWSLQSLAAGLQETASALAEAALAPWRWRESLSEAEWQVMKTERLPTLAVVILATFLVGFPLRRFLNGRYGYIRDGGHVTQARRLGAAVVRAVADGVIPAAAMTIIYVWSRNEVAGVGAPLLADALEGLTIGLAMVALAYAGLSAALTPNHPDWRVLTVSDEAARKIRFRGLVFAAISALDVFVWTALQTVPKSAEFLSVYAVVACGARALALLPLLRSSIWTRVSEQPEAAEAPETPEAKTRDPFWLAARIAAALLLLGAVGAALLGYAELALFVSRALAWTLVTAAGLFLLRGAARETIQAAMNSRVVRRWLDIGPDGADTMTFWGHALLDPLFLVAAAILTAPYWGFTQREMLTWAGNLMSGFSIGETTISPIGIGIAIAAFLAVLALSQMAKSALLHRLLPRTRIDTGVQNSLGQGFGYLGMALALAVGVSALGVDLSNLAIVAGALSVGIGFGLQSVVNNFVSGLILLVERPVKVGDWVIVGDQQGIVKRIAIRATEIETFERSSVILPNSDLISNRVINRTHKDRYGRVDVAVGVAYGTDTEKVERVLLEIAEEHPDIVSTPAPFVLFQNFGDSSLDFELRFFLAENIRGFRISSAIRHEIARRFEAESIEIPFPQRVVHMHAAKDG